MGVRNVVTTLVREAVVAGDAGTHLVPRGSWAMKYATGHPTGDAEGLRECKPYEGTEGTQDKQD